MFFVALAFTSKAQSAKLLADKIIAIVGDKIVLKSDIVNYIDDLKRQGNELPPNVECVLLEKMMQDKALILQAEKDSLPISDEEVEAELDQRIRYFISQLLKLSHERKRFEFDLLFLVINHFALL